MKTIYISIVHFRNGYINTHRSERFETHWKRVYETVEKSHDVIMKDGSYT